MWSSDSLKYDPDFVLNIKPTSAEETKYMSIAGMYNADRDWTKTEGRTQEQCEVLCDKGAACLPQCATPSRIMCCRSKLQNVCLQAT